MLRPSALTGDSSFTHSRKKTVRGAHMHTQAQTQACTPSHRWFPTRPPLNFHSHARPPSLPRRRPERLAQSRAAAAWSLHTLDTFTATAMGGGRAKMKGFNSKLQRLRVILRFRNECAASSQRCESESAPPCRERRSKHTHRRIRR